MAGKRHRRYFGQLKQRGSRPGWYVVFRHPEQDKPIERLAGPTKGLAEERLARIHTLLSRGLSLDEIKADVFGDLHGSRLTFRAAVPMYLADAAKHLKPSTHEGHSQRLDLLSRAPWAGAYLGKITPVAITRWVAARMKTDDASAATVNRDVSVGSALFTWAVEMGYVSDNPFRKVKRKDERGRARFTWLTAAECWALIESMPRHQRGFVLAAIHTGMRRAELIGLQWRHVDLVRREIEIDAETEKTGRGRVVSLTEPLYELLSDLKSNSPTLKIDGSDHVFVSRARKPHKRGTISRAVKTAAGTCKGISASKREKVTLHTLRHTAASLMVQSGVALYDVGKILGHTTPMITQRYAHLAPDAARNAIARLDGALACGHPSSTSQASG